MGNEHRVVLRDEPVEQCVLLRVAPAAQRVSGQIVTGDWRVMPTCRRIKKDRALLGYNAHRPRQTGHGRPAKLLVGDVSTPRLEIEACERPVTKVERSLVRKTAAVSKGSVAPVHHSEKLSVEAHAALIGTAACRVPPLEIPPRHSTTADMPGAELRVPDVAAPLSKDRAGGANDSCINKVLF